MSRISIEVSEDLHAKIKVMASLQNKSIKNFIIENIFKESNQKFNKSTIAAIEEVQNEKNLNVYDSVENLFSKFK
jgi:uncharacterized protein (DUF1778 family)